MKAVDHADGAEAVQIPNNNTAVAARRNYNVPNAAYSKRSDRSVVTDEAAKKSTGKQKAKKSRITLSPNAWVRVACCDRHAKP